MRRAQGLPVNMIVLTALALLVLVVIAAFFITGFGGATSSIQTVNATQAQCQGKCQNLAISGFNYDTCDDLDSLAASNLQGCDSFGSCRVTTRLGASCKCLSSGCT